MTRNEENPGSNNPWDKLVIIFIGFAVLVVILGLITATTQWMTLTGAVVTGALIIAAIALGYFGLHASGYNYVLQEFWGKVTTRLHQLKPQKKQKVEAEIPQPQPQESDAAEAHTQSTSDGSVATATSPSTLILHEENPSGGESGEPALDAQPEADEQPGEDDDRSVFERFGQWYVTVAFMGGCIAVLAGFLGGLTRAGYVTIGILAALAVGVCRYLWEFRGFDKKTKKLADRLRSFYEFWALVIIPVFTIVWVLVAGYVVFISSTIPWQDGAVIAGIGIVTGIRLWWRWRKRQRKAARLKHKEAQSAAADEARSIKPTFSNEDQDPVKPAWDVPEYDPSSGLTYEQFLDSLEHADHTRFYERKILRKHLEEEQAEAAKYEVADTVGWDEHPGVKYYIKRFWRIILCWALAVGVVVLRVEYLQSLIGYWSLIPTYAALLFAGWYTERRTKKWRELRIRVVGNHGFIVDPRIAFYLLNGETQRSHLMYFNNVTVRRTFWENLFGWKTGTVIIETSIPNDDKSDEAKEARKNNDKFRELTDVKRPDEFADYISRRNDEITRGLTPMRRIGIGGTGAR